MFSRTSAAVFLLLPQRRSTFLSQLHSVGIWSRSRSTMAASETSPFTVNPFKPPASITPSHTIDREAFVKMVVVPALQFNKKQTHQILKAFKCATFERPRFPVIRDVPEDLDKKFLLLDPGKISSVDAFSDKQKAAMKENEIDERLHEYTLPLTYKDWQADEVLRCLLPSDVEVPTGFSRIGHIIHLNLRPAQLEYKHLIGEVLLEKTAGIKTVVNKLNEIDNTYRFFSMECIAGEEDTVVTVKEHHFAYSFDFAKVYWNPRLSTEHQRIVDMLQRTDAVYDAFAGVGPFAIPAAKKGCQVFANDLNPESYHWLQHNAKLNKVVDRVVTSNLDGRDFIQTVIKPDLMVKAKSSFHSKLHLIMNLPAIAIEFLDALVGLLQDVPESKGQIPEIIVHCHCFSKAVDPVRDARERVEEILQCRLETCSIHNVRDVAPNKEMMCVTFTVPESVLFGAKPGGKCKDASNLPAQHGDGGPDTKRQRVL